MPVKVETKGPMFARPTAQVIGRSLREVYERRAPEAVTFLKREGRVDRGAYRDSIAYRVKGTGINTALELYADSPDAKFVEEGRKPGKQPPLEPAGGTVTRGPNKGKPRMQSIMVSWLMRKGYDVRTAQSKGYAVAKKIARRGVEGAHQFRDFKEKHAAFVNDLLRDMGETVARRFND